MSFNKSIASLSLVNIFSTIFTLINSIAIAQIFGTTRQIEVFFAASVLLNIILNLSLSGSFGEILIPIYHNLKINRGRICAQKHISAVINWYTAGIAIISTFIYICAPWLIKIIVPGFEPSDHHLGAQFIRAFAPILIFLFVNGQIKALLNAENLFGKAELAGVFSKIIKLFIIILGFKAFGIWVMVISWWAITLFEFAIILFLYIKTGARYYLVLGVGDEPLLPVFKQILSALPNMISSQLFTIVINSGLSTLSQGSYAVYNYAVMLTKRLQGIFLKPILTVFFSSFSQSYFDKNRSSSSLIRKALNNFMFILFPAFTVTIFAGKPGLAFMWFGENYSKDDINLALMVIIIHIAIFLFVSLNAIARKILIVKGYVKLVFSLTSISYIFSSVFCWYAIQKWSFNGVLVSISFTAILQTVVLFLMLSHRKIRSLFFYPPGESLKWMGVSALTILVMYLLPGTIVFSNLIYDYRFFGLINAVINFVLVIITMWLGASAINISAVNSINSRISNIFVKVKSG